MKIVEIIKSSGGGHRNQITSQSVNIPEGWAVVPDDMVCTNFPFGDLIAQKINGVMTVVSWFAGKIPDPEPTPEPEPTTDEILDVLLGVTNE